MLKQRIITAVLIVAGLLLALVYLPPLMLSLLFAALLTLAAWEWSNLAGIQLFTARLLYCAVCISGMVAAAWYSRLFSGDIHDTFIKEILRLACLWWALALLWVKSYPASASLWGSVPVRCVMGLLVLLPTWLAISYLRQLEQGVLLILMVIALVAAADIGAYFAGRRWGRAKLAPSVSPGKSWAGFWGGLGSAMVLAMALWWL